MFNKFLIFLFLAGLVFAQEVKLASWNLKNVSLNSLVFKKSISQINKYIKSKNDFDVIALQELRDKQIIYFLSGGIAQIIFSDFKRIVSDKKGAQTHKEVYGFLVNDKYKDIQEVEFSNYKEFARPPMAIVVEKKFAVVNLHVVYGKDKQKRIQEVKALKKIIKFIYSNYNIAYENIFIAGDFNLTAKEIKKIHKDMSVYIEDKTTLGRTKFSKNYDHFLTFNPSGITKANQEMVGDFKFFHKNISDHIPIEGVFTLQ